MKEATGELNVTVITVVAIAAVAAFFYAFVWPAIQNSLISGQACANAAPDMTQGTDGQDGYISCGGLTDNKYTCTYYSNSKKYEITCTQKQS